MKTVIVIRKLDDVDNIEVFSHLRGLCREKGYKYNTLKNFKFPFDHDNFKFYRKPVNQK